MVKESFDMGIPRGLGPRKCGTRWLLVGYSLATRWLLVGYSLATCWIVVAGRDPKKVLGAAVGSTSALHGRTWAPLEPSWGKLEPTWGQLGAYLR